MLMPAETMTPRIPGTEWDFCGCAENSEFGGLLGSECLPLHDCLCHCGYALGMYVCICICVILYVCICVCLCVCVYVYVCLYNTVQYNCI